MFLHGLTGSGACWIPLVRGLEDVLDAVTPDARGHGAADAPPEGVRYDDLADDVLTLMRERGLELPLLVGHSMGGMTAALVAARHPTLVSALVLIDPTFLSAERQQAVYESDAAEQHRRAVAAGRSALAADLRARHPHRSQEIIELLADARMHCRSSAFDILTPPTPDYLALVRGFRAPTLLVIAEGGVIPSETAAEIQRCNSIVEVACIENAGHGIPFDQPNRLAEIMRAFLRSHA